jgi:hypothetical protein
MWLNFSFSEERFLDTKHLCGRGTIAAGCGQVKILQVFIKPASIFDGCINVALEKGPGRQPMHKQIAATKWVYSRPRFTKMKLDAYLSGVLLCLL